VRGVFCCLVSPQLFAFVPFRNDRGSWGLKVGPYLDLDVHAEQKRSLIDAFTKHRHLLFNLLYTRHVDNYLAYLEVARKELAPISEKNKYYNYPQTKDFFSAKGVLVGLPQIDKAVSARNKSVHKWTMWKGSRYNFSFDAVSELATVLASSVTKIGPRGLRFILASLDCKCRPTTYNASIGERGPT
jgi:hypothetical protein